LVFLIISFLDQMCLSIAENSLNTRQQWQGRKALTILLFEGLSFTTFISLLFKIMLPEGLLYFASNVQSIEKLK